MYAHDALRVRMQKAKLPWDDALLTDLRWASQRAAAVTMQFSLDQLEVAIRCDCVTCDCVYVFCVWQREWAACGVNRRLVGALLMLGGGSGAGAAGQPGCTALQSCNLPDGRLLAWLAARRLSCCICLSALFGVPRHALLCFM
jgi:hypothetical protein